MPRNKEEEDEKVLEQAFAINLLKLFENRRKYFE